MRRLNHYYFFVGIPVLAVVLGTIFFFDAIASTVKGNPHPQINYIIFALIVVGCYQMTMHVVRINREARHFYLYRKALRNGASQDEIDALLEGVTRQYDVELLMQLIEEVRGRALNSVQHAAIESELERFAARQNRRLMLSNFMSGMMVGMGLLGTFIGLLGALAEIGNLIGSFSLGAGMSDPVAAITELVARLTAPMQAMGVAFSASLFGVLGSLIMGALMVAVRSASSDLVALVQSGTSVILDITDESSAGSHLPEIEPLAKALGNLSEHSPLLQGLAVALDQSERRVRELTQGLTQLSAEISSAQSTNQQLVKQATQQNQTNEQTLNLIGRLQSNMANLSANQESMVNSTSRFADLLEQHIDMTQHQANLQQSIWQEQSNLQKNQLITQAQTMQQLLDSEHQARNQQFKDLKISHESGLEIIARHLNATEKLMSTHTSKFESLLTTLAQSQQAATLASESLAQVLTTSNNTLQTDNQARTQLLLHMHNTLSEVKLRNEQIVHMLAKQADPVATA